MFHLVIVATGCHFKDPIALRHKVSPALLVFLIGYILYQISSNSNLFLSVYKIFAKINKIFYHINGSMLRCKMPFKYAMVIP